MRYFRRGAHRANRFSIRVADIKTALLAENLRRDGVVTIEADEYRQLKNLQITFPGVPTGTATLVLAPAPSLDQFPALVGGDAR